MAAHRCRSDRWRRERCGTRDRLGRVAHAAASERANAALCAGHGRRHRPADRIPASVTGSPMAMNEFPWLIFLIFLPLVGAAALFVVKETSVRLTALGVTLADLLISLPLWWLFDSSSSHMQFGEQALWITAPPIHYRLGLDGISLPLVLMTTLLVPLCVLISWQSIQMRIRSFMAMLLLMEGAMIGVFAALDFVLFYVFWEAMLIPMYLLIGIWGGPNRLYAAIKFFLYTLAGSVLLLVALLVLYFQGGYSFAIVQLSQGSYSI